MRRLFRETSQVERWRDCAVVSVIFLAGAATLHFVTSGRSGVSFGERAFESLAFSTMTLAAGLAFGLLVWGGSRLMPGRHLEMKDTVLWLASLFGVVCVSIAVLS
jgi:hypothetical protein